jgi:hypothetical protein
MKALLSALAEEAKEAIQPPADPVTVMTEFCKAMSARTGKPIELLFRTFPPGVPVSGLRLDLGERGSMIVVEANVPPEAQLVIFGHELWHEQQGHCGHRVAGMSAAARSLTGEPGEAIQRAAEQILDSEEVPREAVLAASARAESTDLHEVEAEEFGLRFGSAVRKWTGPHAEAPVTHSTVEGRLNASLFNRAGDII